VNTAQYAGLSTSTLLNMVTFGTSGSSFGIWHKSSGSFSTFISQSDWSSDKMDGSAGFYNPSGMNLDITKGNVYQIKYQYLGYGNLYFYIENKDTGDFQLVHQIKYPNSNTVPSFRNPSLNLVWAAENFANGTEPKVVMGSSGALFIEGLRRLLGPRNSFDNNKNLAMTSSTAVFTLRNATNFNGIHNRAQISFGTLSIASDMANINSGMQVLQIWKNVTLNTSSFRPINGTSTDAGVSINGESVISYDTTGSVVTSGSSSYVLFNQSISRNSNSSIDLSDSDIYMAPGDTLVFLVKTLGTSGQTSSVSVNWTEDI
jgi:hypothetical protein